MESLTYDRVRSEMEPLDGYGRVRLHHLEHPKVEIAEGGGIVLRIPKDSTDPETEHDDFIVTKDLWSAMAKELGAGTRYFDNTPARLLLPQVNWWFSDEADRDEIFMLTKPGNQNRLLGVDLLKPGRFPVSATRLLETVHGTIADKGGEPVYSYYERTGLRDVAFSCIQPHTQHEVQGSRQVGDILRAGVVVQFSPIGLRPVTVSAYTDRLICTNGMTTTDSLDAWSAPGGEGNNDPYEWIPRAIDAAWDRVSGMFEEADRLAQTDVPEDAVETIVTDLFDTMRTPQSLRAAVLRRLANQNVESMWDISNAITWAATHDEKIKEARHRVRLMATGGDFAQHSERCEVCSHLLN